MSPERSMTESERKFAEIMAYAQEQHGLPVSKWAHMPRKERRMRRRYYERLMARDGRK